MNGCIWFNGWVVWMNFTMGFGLSPLSLAECLVERLAQIGLHQRTQLTAHKSRSSKITFHVSQVERPNLSLKLSPSFNE